MSHAISTRIGGVSRKPYDGLNLGEHVGDRIEDVRENRRLLSNALGIELGNWVSAQQVHRLNLAIVDVEDRGEPRQAGGSMVPETDAMIMERAGGEGLALATFSADCPLVIVVHRKGRAMGVAHAGWRTTVGGIIASMVKTLCERFALDVRDLLAGISPSIGPSCYRVGADVYRTAQSAPTRCDRFMKELDGSSEAGQPAWLFDLWQANLTQLVEAGVPREHVVPAGICNHCHTEEFFSYRVEGPTTGRYTLVAGFK